MVSRIKFVVTLIEREKPTINKSIQSLRDCWINETIYIYAEPWTYQIEDNNIKLEINEVKRWCFMNFDYSIKQNKDKEYVIYFQDDYIFRQWFKEELEKIISEWKDFAYYNFILDYRVADVISRQGWNDIRNGWSNIWACYLFNNIERIINHPFYANHLKTYIPKRNQQIDACIWQIGKELWLPCYLPSYSYIAHIWESTIGHSDNKLWVFFKKL